MNDQPPPGGRPEDRPPTVLDDPSITGPLDRATAIALLARADELLAGGDFLDAARYYSRVVGFDEVAVTAGALLGLGNALYRLDRDEEAEATWEEVLRLPETPSTYQAWRHLAATRVRQRDLRGAIAAYREADRRAPAGDKAEIANRLGWLAKETGDTRGARRQFARGRRGEPLPLVTYLIIAATVVTTVTAWSAISGDQLGPVYAWLELNKAAVASGEYWRLFTVTLVHAPPDFGYIHLLTNMYALYLVGPIVEQIYGWPRLLLMYVASAAAGSTASFLFTPESSVGASGAIFGLFGVVFAVSRTHHPMLDRRSRALFAMAGAAGILAPERPEDSQRPPGVGRGRPRRRDRRRGRGRDPDVWAGPGAGACPGPQTARGNFGRITLTRAPCGATCSACAEPPCAAASSLTIARPSPAPGPVRAGSAR